MAATTPSPDAQRFTLRGPDGSEASISDLREGFRQGYVFELLDITAPNTPLEVHVLVLNPSAYTLSEPFQVDITPGQGDEVVTEETGIIVREIKLEGTFGLAPKTARGFVGAQGGGQALTGTEHFNKLRNLFRRYSALKKDPAKGPNTRLVFHALRDDDHFVVVPRQFETPRDAQSRIHYKYRITMTAVAEATVSGLRRDTPQSNGFDDAVRDINEAFNDGRAAFAEVTANIGEIRRKVGNIQAVMVQAASVLNAVGNFVRGASGLINYPLQLVATTTDMLARAGDDLVDATATSGFGVLTENARSLQRLEAAIDRITLYDDRFAQLGAEQVATLFQGERRVSTADVDASGSGSAPGAGGATVGSRTRAALGADSRLAGLDVASGRGYEVHEVRRTDSVESIATRYGTTPEAVVLLNNLVAPYIVPGGGPGLAGEGDHLLVPARTPRGGSSGRGAVDYLTPEEALYGVDLALAPHDDGELFDLRVETVRGGYDAELVSGIANVAQGTEITVNTELGTTQFLPDVGIRRNVGVKGTTQHVLLSSIVLREAILADPRISGIDSARVVLDGDTLTQEITPVVKGRLPGATLVLPFGRVSSGE